MKQRRPTVFFCVALFVAGLQIPEGKAQEAPNSPKLVQASHLIGLTGVKDNAKGTLSVVDGQLHFVHDKTSSDIKTSSIEDVVSGADSQKAVGKTIGTLSMAAPYGGGRFLSLFRKKIDTLTIQYRDPDGALHGAIFILKTGTSDDFKKDLVAQGAHSVLAEEQKKVPANPAPNPAGEDKKQ